MTGPVAQSGVEDAVPKMEVSLPLARIGVAKAIHEKLWESREESWSKGWFHHHRLESTTLIPLPVQWSGVQKHPRGSHLAEDGESGVDCDGMLSATRDDVGRPNL